MNFDFDDIEATKVVLRNTKLYVNKEEKVYGDQSLKKKDRRCSAG
jgi:hypothetical protein